MAFEHKDGKGSMFWNTDKTPDKENWPDWRGDFKINGQIYEIAGWNKSSKRGDRMIGLSVKPKQQNHSWDTKDQDLEQQADQGFDDLNPF